MELSHSNHLSRILDVETTTVFTTSSDDATTTTDYETKTLELYPNANSITAWGGEDEETPVYGTVKIAIRPKSGSTLTETTKNSIVTSLKTFNVASVTPQIVDPEITNILLMLL